MTRVTLDSNVYLSGFVFGGKPKRVLEMAIDGEIEVAVSDPFVQPTIEALCDGGRTGEVGDGKIFVVPLERVVRIRTGETDLDAVTPVGS